jgi:transcription elongation GreA/GreB family factor
VKSLRLPDKVVVIGSTVAIRDVHSNEREIYTLTHPSDADINCNRISSLAPVGKALYGRRAGETVEVDAPGGSFPVRIEAIERELECEYARAG